MKKRPTVTHILRYMDDYLAVMESARGQRRALKAQVINDAIGLPPASATTGVFREVRLLAGLALSVRGVLVCSGNAGYWLPATLPEVEATERRLRATARSLVRRAEAIHYAGTKAFAWTPPLIAATTPAETAPQLPLF